MDNKSFTGDEPPKSARTLSPSDISSINDDVTKNGNAPNGHLNGNGVSNGSLPAKDDLDQEEDVEVVKQKLRDRDPVFFCRWITSYPKSFFAGTLIAHLFLVFISGALIGSGYELVPIEFGRLPLYIPGEADYLRSLAWFNRDEPDEIIERTPPDTADGTEKERSLYGDVLEMYYRQKGGNIFTKENLQAMKRVEDEYFNNEEYQRSFCHLNHRNPNQPVCSKPTSVLRYFDGTYGHVSGTFNDPNFDNIPAVLYLADTAERTTRGFQFHKADDAVITPTEASSIMTRSRIVMGWPLSGYTNTTVKEDEQKDKIKDFEVDNYKKKSEDYYSKGVGEMNFFFGSGFLLTATIEKQVIVDMSLAIGSLFFIVVFVAFQTGSFWITLLAVLSILTSFLGANLIYRVVLDYKYLGIFLLTIFIILGIGADNIFVVFDTWKESGHYKYKSLAHRMSDVYRKAVVAMLFTSTTTAIAFIVSATSPFIVISSFGVFAGILVVVNYLSVIIYFPTVVITYHLYWEKYKCCCCCIKNGRVGSDEDLNDGSQSPRVSTSKPNVIVRFLSGPYYNFVTHKIYRWVILGCFAVAIILAIVGAAHLKINEEQTKFLKDSTNFGQYLLRMNEFVSSDDAYVTNVLLVWGLKEQDLGKCHKTDTECDGKVIWDDSFSMTDPQVQTDLKRLCNTLMTLSPEKIEDLKIRKNNNGEPEVDCFVNNMDTFLQSEHNAQYTTGGVSQRKYASTERFSYPVDRSEVRRIMQGGFNRDIYSQAVPSDWNHFETVASYWLYNGINQYGDQFDKYNEMVGEGRTSYTKRQTLSSGASYYYGTEMKYIAISINTTIERSTLGFPKGLPTRDNWEDFLDEQKKTMHAALQGGFQITPPRPGDAASSLWHWLKIQKLLANSAVNGLLIGVCLSFPILTIATHNIIIGLIATLIICCITISVIGIMPVLGWKLGLLESLNLVLVVGLAVDYVVHLAEGYSRSSHRDRLGRTKDMLQEVGISVLSGAATTLGASLFLLFAAILFFVQFGTFMFCTIGFSIIYAIGLFVTVMGTIGPQNNTGSLSPLYKWIKNKMCSKSAVKDKPVAVVT